MWFRGCEEYFDEEGSVPIPRTEANSDDLERRFSYMKINPEQQKTAKELLRNFVLTSMDDVSSLEVGYMVYYAVAP